MSALSLAQRHRKTISEVASWGVRIGSIGSGVVVLTVNIERRYDSCMDKPAELLQGTLDLLILRTLELQPLHGVGVADRIEQVTNGVFVVGPGSLFPALHRLEERGWIKGQWGELESGRRAKSYALTAAGRKQLTEEMRNWQRAHTAVNQVLAQEV